MEAKKVVGLLLKEIIEISDDEDSLEDITLVENCTPKPSDKDMKYINQCEFCGFEAKANRRYMVLQLFKKHKETCSRKFKCSNCVFISKDRMVMRPACSYD